MKSFDDLLSSSTSGLPALEPRENFLTGSRTGLNHATEPSALFTPLSDFSHKHSSSSSLKATPRDEVIFNQQVEIGTFASDVQTLGITGNASTAKVVNGRSIAALSQGANKAGKDSLTGMVTDSALLSRDSNLTVRGRSDSLAAAVRLPDLVGTIERVIMPRTIDPKKKDDKGQIKVDITNRGSLRARGFLNVSIYASPDPVLSASDQLLDQVNQGNVQIQPNNTRKFTFDFTNPAGVAPGAYYLIVNIDPTGRIAESNETNNAANKRVSANGTDVVLDWNATLLNAIVTERSSPPSASRSMAVLHTAIYDAVTANSTRTVSREAAVAGAAHQILISLYPNQTAILNQQLTMSLAEIANGAAETNGIALGRSVADAVLAARRNDGSAVPSSYIPGTAPGRWQPTLPGNQPALLPHWGNVTPFVMRSGSQFRPDGPPALSSAEWAAEFNEVKTLGGVNSTVRTTEQTEMANFWADGAGTFTPPGHWNLIAEQLSVVRRNTLVENARLFAMLNVAEADAGIAAWDAKYIYDLWRPITAIRLADQDGNPNTVADPTWTPLVITPPFPEYVSGHSTYSGAASTVLASFFGDNTPFETTSIGLPGVVRSYSSFSQAADEAGMSRVYGGIHFQSGNQDGLVMGRALGRYVVERYAAT
ncbi:phosphatase PAP2 family protein [Leptolyngbya sp. FACHB-671]|uniref:CARDB domain-containing protein n=1 Tax=Leptolyngbya sp. FACHB-671 TaxID=2692812 RepID=UPI00168729CA|nr:CARDB domain-containing protein [Leptolyngbya sp. FACHB-671]MBD2069041.1 phosphatase PAP2 family protein [Leptolyngbya sp. FACHB-671]